MIAIAGASASGKTYFAETLVQEIRAQINNELQVALIGEDAYYRDRPELSDGERAALNYDHPEAFEHSLLLHHLQELRAGKPIQVPSYDFVRHRRNLEAHQHLPAARVVIVEGILVLSDESLCPQFDLKLFVDTPMDTCLLRRIHRDMSERGRSLQAITEQYEKTVKPMYHQFIEPAKARADLIVNGAGEVAVAIDLVNQKIQSLLA